ncbi:MAG: aminoglycoside phosphotransferase family protein [Propionibacteriaceae bacterium]
MDDGSELLSTAQVGPLLRAAVDHAGGHLRAWQLDHIDAQPQLSTTATYTAVVDWPWGRRDELLGVSARAHGLVPTDERAEIFADGDREVAVWIYPNDPDLPGLSRAAYTESMATLFNDAGMFTQPISPSDIKLDMIGYRPRRRAVLRCAIARTGRTYFVKVLRERAFHDILHRHEVLLAAGVPAPTVALSTTDGLLVLDELPGTPLARAVFGPQDPCTAEQLITLLDSMPMSVASLERRPPWSDAVGHYAELIAQAMPSQQPRLNWLVENIQSGLAHIPLGNEPTHGDFHEGQVFVADGAVSGILDIDTIGPGRRADDLACLVAHLSTIQRMNAAQAQRVHHLIRTWVPVFDERVDATELRLRAAAVIVSLATGPYRSQDTTWEADTVDILDAAEALVRQVT